MCRACRDQLYNTVRWEAAAHAGLLLNSYLKDQDDPVARQDLLERAATACSHVCSVYSEAFGRWARIVGNGAVPEMVRVAGRAVPGLGVESSLETGLTLHHTYGTPIILGSALKGLAAHYCNQVWGVAQPEFKKNGSAFTTIFGTTEDSGHIIFADAWVTPDSLAGSLVLDVMTVHHPDYYQPAEPLPPSDFDDPNPIAFLSIRGKFQLFVKCDVPGLEGDRWARLAMDLLLEALDRWGIGGKTAAGYGRMVRAEATAHHNQQGEPPGSSRVEERRAGYPQPQTSPAQATPPCRANEQVEAALSSNRTARGGWKAVYAAGGRSWEGPIQNSNAVPADKKPGDKVRLEVAFVKPGEIAFRWPKSR
ncbi:MAG: type III-B CRISPR module RAMP protein Cmr6 [Limnochordaceae bacterium]|nr:type III-B CRISPR module RAMP protein Cmr6 [Limnochordaceae bacterium]